MITRAQKEEMVRDMAAILKDTPSALFVDYRGVNTARLRTLRKKLQDTGGTLRVIRKTLFQRALQDAGIAEKPASDLFEGQLGVVSGFSDPVGAAKALTAFRKELEAAQGSEMAFAVRGGFLDGRFLTAADAKTLAEIPSRPELFAKLAGSFAAPLRGLVTVLSGPHRGLAQVLKARSEKLG